MQDHRIPVIEETLEAINPVLCIIIYTEFHKITGRVIENNFFSV